MIICDFCKKSFYTKSNLVKHQKTAKYCLKIQGKDTAGLFNCKYCNKKYNQKIDLQRHILVCKQRMINNATLEKEQIIQSLYDKLKEKEEIIKKHEEHIKTLEDKLENIAMKAVGKPTHMHLNNQRITNTINNLTPITEEHLKSQVQYLTEEHVKEGAYGIAKYALEYPLKNKIVCSDFSRRIVKYKDKDGNIVLDPEMSKLMQQLFIAIESRNTELCKKCIRDIQQQFSMMNMNSNNEMNEHETKICLEDTDVLLYRLNNITMYKINVLDIANGLRPDLYHDVLKIICSKMVL